MFVETSAKTMDGINTLFDNLIEVITGEEEGDTTNVNPNQTANGGSIIKSNIDNGVGAGEQLNRANAEKKDTEKKKKCCGK